MTPRALTRATALAAGALLVTSLPLVGAAHAAPAAATKGTVALGCTIAPFGNAFDYSASIKLTGKRQGARLALVAKLNPMPGVSPVPVNGEMESTLVVRVGSAKATLAGASTVSVGPNASIPVPPLTGSVKAPKKAKKPKKLAVKVVSYAFELPTYGVSGTCAPTGSASLGKLTVR